VVVVDVRARWSIARLLVDVKVVEVVRGRRKEQKEVVNLYNSRAPPSVIFAPIDTARQEQESTRRKPE
jgi:hypothetical protein